MLVYIYALVVFLDIVFTIPQIMQIIRTKDVEGFSLPAYGFWTVTQVIIVLYAISLKDLPLIFTQLAWQTYYIGVISLIIYYRYFYKGKTRPALKKKTVKKVRKRKR